MYRSKKKNRNSNAENAKPFDTFSAMQSDVVRHSISWNKDGGYSPVKAIALELVFVAAAVTMAVALVQVRASARDPKPQV